MTLTNNGDVALTLVSATVASGDFNAVNHCGTSLAAHSTCSIAVTFTPKSVGSLTGTLVVSDVQRAQVVTLTGTAVAGPGVSLLPGTLTFPQTGVGNATAPQVATLTNNGGVPLTLTAITITGDFGMTAASGACASTTTLPVGGSCLVPIAFAPKSGGPRTGTVTMTSNATTQTLALSGAGIDFTLAASGSTTATIANGKSAIYPMLLTPATAGSQPVTFTCTGAPTNSKCTVVSTYTDLSATSTVSVTVLTGTTAAYRKAALDGNGPGKILRSAAWALFVPVLLAPAALRRRRLPALLLVLLLVGAAALQGCGSGRRIPEDSTGGSGSGGGSGLITPAGTYNLTVSASAAGLTRQVPLTLIVTAQ